MIYLFEEFRLSPSGYTLSKNDSEREIEPQVLELIILLVKNHGQLITKDDIIDRIWAGQIRSESSITTLISQARLALDDSGKSQRFIKTVHNKGYKFIGDVTVKDHDGALISSRHESTTLEISDAQKRLPVKTIMLAGVAALGAFAFMKFSPKIVPAKREVATILENSIPENMSEYAELGFSRNPNVVPKGKAVTFDISDHKVGDIMDGGDGFDTIDLRAYTQGGFFVGLPGEVARDLKYKKGEGEYILRNIENIIGTPQDDLFRGSIFPNVIRGEAGDDQLFGFGDQDIIYGGPGNDYLNGGYELDVIYGGPGNDRIVVATISRGDHIDGGEDEDTFDLSKFTAAPYHVDLSKELSRELSDREVDTYKIVNVENIVGTPMDDTLIGDGQNNVIQGGDGNDRIDGGAGWDVAVYQGKRLNYMVNQMADNTLMITDNSGYDGIDTVTGIEMFKFSDVNIETGDMNPALAE